MSSGTNESRKLGGKSKYNTFGVLLFFIILFIRFQAMSLDAKITFLDKHEVRMSGVFLLWTFLESDNPSEYYLFNFDLLKVGTSKSNRLLLVPPRGNQNRVIPLVDIDRIIFAHSHTPFREGDNVVGLAMKQEVGILFRTTEKLKVTDYSIVSDAKSNSKHPLQFKLFLIGNDSNGRRVELPLYGNSSLKISLQGRRPGKNGAPLSPQLLHKGPSTLEIIDEQSHLGDPSIFRGEIAKARVWADKPPFVTEEVNSAKQIIEKFVEEKGQFLFKEIEFLP